MPGFETISRSTDPSRPQRLSQAQSIRTILMVITVLSGTTGLGLIFLLLGQPTWQLASLTGLLLLTCLYSLVATLIEFHPGTILRDAAVVFVLFSLSVIATAAFLANLGIAAAIVFLVFTLILSSALPGGRLSDTLVVFGILTAVACALLGDFSPFAQIESPMITIYTPAILGVLFMISVVLLTMQYVAATLRVRLVTTLLAVVIVPLAVLSLAQSQFMFSTLRAQKDNALLMASRQAATRLDEYLSRTQGAIWRVSSLEVFRAYIEMPSEQRQNSPQEQALRETLKIIDIDELDSPIYRSSYAVLDAGGLNIFDTYSDATGVQFSSSSGSADPLVRGEGANEGSEPYFTEPFQKAANYISPVFVEGSGTSFFYISAPIKNRRGEVIGVLRMRNDALQFQQIIREFSGLTGDHSYAVLLDENNIRLADGLTPQYLYRLVAPLPEDRLKKLQAEYRLPNLPASMVSTGYSAFAQALDLSTDNPMFSADLDPESGNTDHPEIGAITSLSSMPWKVVFLEQNFNDSDLRKSQRQLTTLIATLIAGIVALIAVGLSRVLSRPIVQLTNTAERIAAGNLDVRANADTEDEFGLLGRAFNTMTQQVRTLVNELEDRVKARTSEVETQNAALIARARQLQTVSEVARQVVSVQELDPLLESVTHLVSERFGFYHVGIFLLDDNKAFAILRAANSEGGRRMLARNHMLPVGRVGIVGNVTGAGNPRIALDVGEDATFFNNPDLPRTRSEMALPLKVGNQIIGALDIQSEAPDAFHEEDIELFTTLADQVAIAIYNNQLYTETARALQEAQTLHRQYLHEEWGHEIASRKVRGYRYNQMGTQPQQAVPADWNTILSSSDPVLQTLPGEDGAPDQALLAVPINVRGETLGVIHIQDNSAQRAWSENEIAVVNEVANQVAVALENARLFESTSRRAEREKKVLEITAQIRSTNEPERMMQIAVTEIQRALKVSRAQIVTRQQPGSPLAEAQDGSTEQKP